jgi:hypothetical protein
VVVVAVVGVPAAQAHLVGGEGAYASAKLAKTQKASKLTKTQKTWIKSIHMLGRSLPSYAR